jgi:hypothetical protein
MMHDYHAGLSGYSEDQLLHDGCAECERRAASPGHGIFELDSLRFARAWMRAGERHKHGLRSASQAETPMLDALWAAQVQFERLGWPIGTLPRPFMIKTDPAEGVR